MKMRYRLWSHYARIGSTALFLAALFVTPLSAVGEGFAAFFSMTALTMYVALDLARLVSKNAAKEPSRAIGRTSGPADLRTSGSKTKPPEYDSPRVSQGVGDTGQVLPQQRLAHATDVARGDRRAQRQKDVEICGCGALYSTSQESKAIGFQLGGDGEPRILRNCPCGSTLSWPVAPDVVEEVAREGLDRYRATAAGTMIDYWREKAEGAG